MIWRIYSFLSMSLSSWEWEYWWNVGFWITSASPLRTNPCLMPIEVELSLGGGPPPQESFKANDGQVNLRISIHIPVAPLEKAPSSFSSPGLKKTGMYPSLITLCVKEALLIWEHRAGYWVAILEKPRTSLWFVFGGKAKKTEQTCKWKFGVCLIQ